MKREGTLEPGSRHSLENHVRHLIGIGFQRVGQWELADGVLVCKLEALQKNKNVLYAFVSGETVLYVGKSVRTLQNRLKGYQKPGPTQRTNQRNNRLIREMLEGGSEVRIFAWADDGRLAYGPFHINLAAGLEDSIVGVLRPGWNGLREK